MSSRQPLVAANWKMNKTCAETISFLSRFIYEIEEVENVDVSIFPPFTALRSATTYLADEKNAKIKIGAQNIHWEEKGAFTGEISAPMLIELGISQVIIGHSERRHLFGETDEVIMRKLKAAVEAGIQPVLCVGETLEQREENRTYDVVDSQTLPALELFKQLDYTDFIIAYEPVWAIGTGVSASPEQANDVIRHIRALVGSVFSPDISKDVRILYGGSVNKDNFADFLSEPDIDGGLVGSASLDYKHFAQLVKIATRYSGD